MDAPKLRGRDGGLAYALRARLGHSVAEWIAAFRSKDWRYASTAYTPQ